jgi:hypothetical protein
MPMNRRPKAMPAQESDQPAKVLLPDEKPVPEMLSALEAKFLAEMLRASTIPVQAIPLVLSVLAKLDQIEQHRHKK